MTLFDAPERLRIVGGLGALLGDFLIFEFIRFSFKDEIEELYNNPGGENERDRDIDRDTAKEADFHAKARTYFYTHLDLIVERVPGDQKVGIGSEPDLDPVTSVGCWVESKSRSGCSGPPGPRVGSSSRIGVFPVG